MADVSTVTSNSVDSKSLWKSVPLLPLPNEENKRLSLEVQNKKTQGGEIQTKIEEQAKVNTLLKNHFDEIVQEIGCVQQMLEARSRQLEAGEHVEKLVKREKSWLLKRKEAIEKEIREIREKQHSIKQNIERKLENKEQIQNNLKMDYVSMEKWLKEASRREEDVKILERYKSCNVSKEKEMQMNIANADGERKKWKRRVRDTGLEIATMQKECSRLAEEFRSAHLQRKDIIEQLERGISKLQKKDRETDDLFEQLSLIREEQTRVEEENKEKKRFYEHSLNGNRKLECEIRNLDLEIKVLEGEIRKHQQRVNSASSELEIQRTCTNKLTFRISQMRFKEKELEKKIGKKRKILQQVSEKNEKLKEDLEKWMNEQVGESNILQSLESTLQKLEKDYKEQKKKSEKNTVKKVKATREMEDVKSEGEILLCQVDNAKSDIRHLKKKKILIDKTLSEQEDSLYKLEYTLLKKEQQVKRRNGEMTMEDEQVELDCKLCRLKSIYEQKKDYLSFVKSHLIDDERELLRVKKKLEAFKMQQDDICQKLDNVKLCISTGNSELKATVSRKENLLVDKCILKVKLERLQQILEKNSNNMLSLEKKNLEFESKVNLQLNDLMCRKNILLSEARKLEQQCQMMATRLNKAKARTDNLQTRYKYLMNSLGLEESEDGKEVELLIKTEQEKTRLQNEIDQMTEALNKEKEDVKTLKNTLCLINASNRMHLSCLNSSEEGNIRVKEIEKHQEILKNRLKHKKQETEEAQNKLSVMKISQEQVEDAIHKMEDEQEKKDNTLSRMHQELNEQQQKIQRADMCGEKLLKSIKESNISVDEKDINIHLLRELNKQVVGKIVDTCNKNPEITSKIRKAFCDTALPPLPRFPSSSSLMSLHWSTSSRESNSSSVKHTLRACSRERKLASPNIISLDIGPVDVYQSSAGSSIKL